MNTHTITHTVMRDAILRLLSDTEIATVSRDEGDQPLSQGDEYIDLSHLDAGIQTATSGARLEPNSAITRRAVSEATWARIVRMVGTR